MGKILVVQHVPHEGLGIIGPLMRKEGLDADFLRVYRDERIPAQVDGYSALIVLGGPMGVYEDDIYPFIRDELRLIRYALKERIPVLGVCLGAQLLAKAAGADVYKGGKKEIGWYDVELTSEGLRDSLFQGLPEELMVFQWHGDTFDVPDGATRLASSKLFPNQVIRVGPRAYGIQFHLEVTEDMIRDWLTVNKDELKLLKSIDPKKIVKEIPANIHTLQAHGRAVISRFLRLVG
jgi:GMP synthase (glutamine-hydrolysing)